MIDLTIVSWFKVPQKQTVPVAPRTRVSPEGSQLEVIHVQNRLPVLTSQLQVEEPREQTVEGTQGHLIIFFKDLFQGMSFYNRLSRENKCFAFLSQHQKLHVEVLWKPSSFLKHACKIDTCIINIHTQKLPQRNLSVTEGWYNILDITEE